MKKKSDAKNSEKEDKEKPDKSILSKFLEKFNFAHESVEHFVFGRSKSEISKSEHEHKDSKESENSKSEDKDEKHDHHGFPMISYLLGPERVKNIKSKKNKILMCTGTFTGILLIIFGAVMITGSADRVADNVVFGEKEVFSVFLILTGILLIAYSFAYKFLGKSFFKGIDNDIESYDKKSSDSAKNNR